MGEPHLILGIGELLWDTFDGSNSAPVQTLGGAPANFTVMAGRLGDRACILSRIGRDRLGRQAVDRLNPLPVDIGLVQVDPVHQTGHVTVSFAGGEPQYIIHQAAAWDFLDLSDEWIKVAARADAICFGTLAQRAIESRKTIQSLLAQTPEGCLRILDVNLRAPFYSAEVLEESLALATVIKMNAEETPVVLNLLGLPQGEAPLPQRLHLGDGPLRSGAEQLLEEFPALQMVAITRGSHGSLLVKREQWHDHPGYPAKTADPIGAGDAFTATLAHYLLRKADLATLNEAGNRWGAWVASQPGAMPDLPEAVQSAISISIERPELRKET